MILNKVVITVSYIIFAGGSIVAILAIILAMDNRSLEGEEE